MTAVDVVALWLLVEYWLAGASKQHKPTTQRRILMMLGVIVAGKLAVDVAQLVGVERLVAALGGAL